ncbi:MAG: glycoside hydrolase family 127 protein, partial [Caldilineaceae bacterium]|nr:glycoside hydrolase family 127 protein [Caldilineaceae bacterium]
MEIKRVMSHVNVQENDGKVAIERGPLVYCAEGVDNGQIANLDRILLDPATAAHFQVRHEPDLLGGVTVLEGP